MFWLYVMLSVLFWGLVLICGGAAKKGGLQVDFQTKAAVINALLLIPLWRDRLWARSLLAAIATSLALVLLWMLIPPHGSAVGLLAVPLALQGFVLVFGHWPQRPPVTG